MKRSLFTFLLLLLFQTSALQVKAQIFTKDTLSIISMSGGNSFSGAWIDFDNDLDLDLFVTNDRNEPNQLFRNDGGGSFTSMMTGALNSDSAASWACSWADYDNDGNLDVFVSNWGMDSMSQFNYLYHNNGDSTFTRMVSSVVEMDNSKSAGAAWNDYDNDGYVDLIVASGILSIDEDNLLYHNKGDGTFEKILIGPLTSEGGRSASVSPADYDNDGDQDILITNAKSTQPNYLYRNNNDGTFTRVMDGTMATDAGTSRGASWADIDNDADLDLLITNWNNEDNFLYINDGRGLLERNYTNPAAKFGGRSEGSGWADVDNDGDLDLYVANFSFQYNYFYLNDGTGDFDRVLSGDLAGELGSSIGVSFGDMDNDGKLDLYVGQANHPSGADNLFYRNTGATGNYLMLRLSGVQTNKSALGARVYIKTAQGWQMRETTSQSGFASINSLWTHFGLGTEDTVEHLLIHWPSGNVQLLHDLPANQTLDITEEDNIPEYAEPVFDAYISVAPPSLEEGLNLKIYKPASLVLKVEMIDPKSGKIWKQYGIPDLLYHRFDVAGLKQQPYLLRVTLDGGVLEKMVHVQP